MGCDIHPIAEVKENGVWKVNTDKVFKNPYYNPERWEENKAQWKKRLDEGDITQEQYDNWTSDDLLEMSNEFIDTPSSARNYDWFSILADVRNGYGFAGVPTGQGFDVIKQPNGLPEDVSKEALLKFFLRIAPTPELEDEEDDDGNYYVSRADAERWGGKIIIIDDKEYVEDPDLHSENFITAEEFEKFDWNQLTMKMGIISLKQYKELRGTNESPETWSGGISGGDNITISQEEADQILDGNDIELTRRAEPWSDREEETRPASEWNVNVQYQWSVLYSEWFEHQIEGTIKPLQELAEKYEDARMVFGFDN